MNIMLIWMRWVFKYASQLGSACSWKCTKCTWISNGRYVSRYVTSYFLDAYWIANDMLICSLLYTGCLACVAFSVCSWSNMLNSICMMISWNLVTAKHASNLCNTNPYYVSRSCRLFRWSCDASKCYNSIVATPSNGMMCCSCCISSIL